MPNGFNRSCKMKKWRGKFKSKSNGDLERDRCEDSW
jgi:hypothetical protein